MQASLPIFFATNIVLILVDASLGYYLAPRMLRFTQHAETDDPGPVIRSIRRMLTGVVTLYMFFNCLAYFRGDDGLMAVVTTLIVLDLGGQLYVRYRTRQRDEGRP